MHQQPPTQSPKPPYLIYTTASHFYLCCTLEHLDQAQYLRIQRETCKVEDVEAKEFFEQVNGYKPLQAMLIVGILILCGEIYLVYVSTASVAYPFPKSDEIYQAESIIHLPFRPSIQYKYSKSKKANEQTLKYLQETVLKKNYYFRYRSDITLSMENVRLHNKPTEGKFFWNQHLVRIFKQNNSHKCWRIPFMQGFVRFQGFAEGCHYLMIARRSKILSGPKLLNRGIWQGDGQSVANFVQTQEIYRIKNDTFSYVSVRGSVPVYWKQSKGTMEFKSDDKNPIGFHSHLQALERCYPEKRVYFISWLMREKEELLLKQKLDICFYHSKQKYHQNEKYRLISIDIDETNKNAIFYLKQLIHHQVSLLMPYKDNFFWVTEENGTQYVMGKQKLIYRVSDVDCTQRTNAVLIELSRKTMRDVQDILSIKYNKSEIFERLEDVVVNKWKQLGSRISRLYVGQEELEVGKKQESGFFTMFNLYKDPMSSQFRQRSIQLFLNEITPKQVIWIQKNLERKLNITSFCTTNSLKFFILSWNCNNLNPLSMNQLSKQLLLKFNRGKIDVVIFNLQQMVELSTYNVLVTIDEEVKFRWRELVETTLNEKIANKEERFDFVAEENLVAITTWVFVKNRVKVKHFQGKESTVVKTGFANGLGGNKGAVIIFLKFDSTWISLVNCHLTAGQGKKVERKQSLQQILYGWLEDKHRDKILQSDITFLIGDLNFRLDWSQQQIKGILYEVKKKFNKDSLKMGSLNTNAAENTAIATHLKPLWQKDQLLTYQKDPTQFLHNFKEKPLTFMPTYKFIKKTHIDEYDDKRSPAWCDRILYEQKMENIVNQILYQDIDINLSDHKPVCGLFEVRIRKVEDKEKYVKVFEEGKRVYYGQKGKYKGERVSQIGNVKSGSSVEKIMVEGGQSVQKKPQQEGINFFCEKQIQANKQDILIDIDFGASSQKPKPKDSNLMNSTELNKTASQNLLDFHPRHKIHQSSSLQGHQRVSPTKNDFLQFHEIISEIERTGNNNSKSKGKEQEESNGNSKKGNTEKGNNLLDLA